MDAAARALTETGGLGKPIDALTVKEFAALSSLITQTTGIRLPPAKKVMLEARLRKRLRALGMESYAQYCELVLGVGRHSEEMVHLIDGEEPYTLAMVLAEFGQRHPGFTSFVLGTDVSTGASTSTAPPRRRF